jgi:hypothetical protein
MPPDLLRHRGRGGRQLEDRGTGTGPPGQAHPGSPGQPPVDRQVKRDVPLARRRPVANAPGQLARADQRAGRAGREPAGRRDEQLTELRDQVSGAPGPRPEGADRPGHRPGVRIPRRHRAREPPQVAEPGRMLAARCDAYGPDHLIQAAERAGAVRPGHAARRSSGPRAVQGHAADGYVRPAPGDPRVSFRVPGRYPHRRRRRGDRPRTRGRRRDMKRPGSSGPRAAYLTTHPALTWLRS